MGIFKYFQRNKEKSKLIRKVSLEEITYDIEKLFNELKDKTKIIKEEINKNLILMINDIRTQINVLKSITLEERREDERLKKIVLENLKFYIDHLEKFIGEFEKIENLEVKEYISEIQLILDNFYKRSFKSYEKATILIGEEIKQIKDIIKNFNKDFVKILQENEVVFIKMNSIKEFKELNNKIKDLGKIREEIDKQTNIFRESRIKLEKQKSFFEEDYHKFKQSEEFKEDLLQEQKFKEELSNLNNKIKEIKEKIDIKLLLKCYHNDNKYNELLKSYRENFMEALESDENLEIVKLVEKASYTNIKKEIFDLKEKIEKMKIRNNKPSQTKLKIFEDRIKNVDLDISGLKEKEMTEIKKSKRFNEMETSLVTEKANKAKDIFENIEIINPNETQGRKTNCC
ncbi:hypothetical protein HYV88_00995 [Candidatus Woesearchaeota archaeon]|nr:hypothetical protein [Candidatus Woesearchaeota archaeon]